MTLKNHYKSLTWLMGFLLTVSIAGCGSDGGGTQAGVVSVSLTDAPACGYDEVNVTVSKVRVHQSDSADDKAAGWTDITLNPARKINLLNLNDPTQPNLALDNLGETPLAAGHYTQLRLVLEDNNGNQPSANWIVLAGQNPITDKIPLETPSAIRSGIKLIHQFTVNSGQRVDLLLDFDACKSIVKRNNGTYALKPVIKVIPFVLNGIEGFVDPNLLSSNVVVSAQINNGEIVRATIPNTSTKPNVRGKFFLARLAAPANYDVVITADGRATAVIAAVPVANSTSITTVSTSGAPITLNASTTHNIDGTVTLSPATDDEPVFLAAKQSFVSGPTVSVKSQVAMLLTNPPIGDFSYTLTLPIASPSLGPYTTPLPIVFTQQPASVAGHYAVQASAMGYVTQSFDKDISAGNGTQDFTLTP